MWNQLFVFLLLLHSTLQKIAGTGTWKNCGSTTDAIQLKSLEIDPNPIQVSGTLYINGEGTITKELTEPIWVNIKVLKKIETRWQKIFKTRVDVCTLSPFIAACPPEFIEQNIPCKCPVAEGSYKMVRFPVTIPDPHLPGPLITGNYQVKIQFSSDTEKLGCYKLTGALAGERSQLETHENLEQEISSDEKHTEQEVSNDQDATTNTEEKTNSNQEEKRGNKNIKETENIVKDEKYKKDKSKSKMSENESYKKEKKNKKSENENYKKGKKYKKNENRNKDEF